MTVRRYDTGDGLVTVLLHADAFGTMVPLLDETGRPVSFERRPGALTRAKRAMSMADTIWSPTIKEDNP